MKIKYPPNFHGGKFAKKYGHVSGGFMIRGEYLLIEADLDLTEDDLLDCVADPPGKEKKVVGLEDLLDALARQELDGEKDALKELLLQRKDG